MEKRLQKFMSEAGIMSRRAAEEEIERGNVTVNGVRAVLGQKIDDEVDIVEYRGKRIGTAAKKNVYIMLNKPVGYVTTMNDEQGRACVAELVEDVGTRVYPIGRLDKESEGLLLFTNDGNFANQLTHPSHQVSKLYRVTVRPTVTEEQLIALANGVYLDDGTKTLPAIVRVVTQEENRSVLEISIKEGKNRQVRRMCAAVGLEVARLRRNAIGPVKLGMLAPGKYRELKPVEINALKAAATKAKRTQRQAEKED